MHARARSYVQCTSWYAGTPYEMGFAHGTLMKARAVDMLNSVWSYLELQVVSEFTPPVYARSTCVRAIIRSSARYSFFITRFPPRVLNQIR